MVIVIQRGRRRVVPTLSCAGSTTRVAARLMMIAWLRPKTVRIWKNRACASACCNPVARACVPASQTAVWARVSPAGPGARARSGPIARRYHAAEMRTAPQIAMVGATACGVIAFDHISSRPSPLTREAKREQAVFQSCPLWRPSRTCVKNDYAAEVGESIFAARMKSLSVSPSILCVQIRTSA